MIRMEITTISHPALTPSGYEANQFCSASCPGSKQEVEMKTTKFFSLPDCYWRKRYLTEHMNYNYEHIVR